jgi:hypothetical protein
MDNYTRRISHDWLSQYIQGADPFGAGFMPDLPFLGNIEVSVWTFHRQL